MNREQEQKHDSAYDSRGRHGQGHGNSQENNPCDVRYNGQYLGSRGNSRRRGRGSSYEQSHDRNRNHTLRSLTPAKLYQANHISIEIDAFVDCTARKFVASAPPFMPETLANIKTRLNDAKESMEPLYNAANADTLLKKEQTVDIYRDLRRIVTITYNAPHVTNAWLKFWELFWQYPNLIPRTDNLHAFFNAELPGSSLSSFYHFMKTVRAGQEFDWRASSLVPDDFEASGTTTAFGDDYGFYEHNKDKWLMNEVNNGNCMEYANIEDFAARIGPESEFGGVDFYAHDAGMDVSGDYNNQELLNAKLHLGCAISGFMTMRPGASFVAKQYTFFESFTWSLLLMYATLFEKFYISKPLSSRPYNSEIYLIGLGYRGINVRLLKLLIARLNNFNTDAFVTSDSVGLACIQRAARNIFNQQREFIAENVHLFETYTIDELRAGTASIKKTMIALWLEKYPITRINDEDRLPSNRV